MNDKKITDDSEFSELKKLLKEIPKVDAPDNFEFELMTRIQNQNFEIKHEKKKNIFSWALTPAIAFAASVFLIFFVFAGEDDLHDNPWNIAPQLINDNIAEVQTNQPKLSIKEKNSDVKLNKQTSNKIERKGLSTSNPMVKDFPFDKESSVNLDEVLQSEQNINADIGSAQLASSSNNNNSRFDGFFLREIKEIPRKDSLESKKDSTNKSKN
jgi:hypothetical protein